MDTLLPVEYVRRVRAGQSIERPVQDFAKYERDSRVARVTRCPAVNLEGILLFENSELRQPMDSKIFVDTDADLRFIRPMRRDIGERGRNVERVVQQYPATVRPMCMELIEPSKRYLGVMIPEGGHDEAGIDLVIQNVRSLVAPDR